MSIDTDQSCGQLPLSTDPSRWDGIDDPTTGDTFDEGVALGLRRQIMAQKRRPLNKRLAQERRKLLEARRQAKKKKRPAYIVCCAGCGRDTTAASGVCAMCALPVAE